MDTTTDHFTPLALRVRGNEVVKFSLFTPFGKDLTDPEPPIRCTQSSSSSSIQKGKK